MRNPGLHDLIEEYRENSRRIGRIYNKETNDAKKKILGSMKRDLENTVFYMEHGFWPDEHPYFRELSDQTETFPVDPADFSQMDPEENAFLWSTYEKYRKTEDDDEIWCKVDARMYNVLTRQQYKVMRRHIIGWSLREIGEDLELNHKTVEEYLNKAKKRLKEVIKDENTS